MLKINVKKKLHTPNHKIMKNHQASTMATFGSLIFSYQENSLNVILYVIDFQTTYFHHLKENVVP